MLKRIVTDQLAFRRDAEIDDLRGIARGLLRKRAEKEEEVDEVLRSLAREMI